MVQTLPPFPPQTVLWQEYKTEMLLIDWYTRTLTHTYIYISYGILLTYYLLLKESDWIRKAQF